MSGLDAVKKYLEHDLKDYEGHFKNTMKTNAPLLDKIFHYIIKSKGKQIRPMFVFLSARLFGDTNAKTFTAASLVELLHTATLVHDDVVDESLQRRGFFSINALWKNKVAVLVGDYLFAQGLHISLDTGQYKMLHIVSQAVKSMAEGELIQLEKARRLDIDEAIYFNIIKKKTASLIAASCGLGTCSTIDDDTVIEKVKLLGENIGICFQIKDDLFDYGTSNVGKPLGIDIKEKKMTLPLIYALNHAPFMVKRSMINIIKNKSEDQKKVKEVIEFVKQSGGLEYAIEKMNEYKAKSFELLQEFPQNEANEKLKILIDYVVSRDH